MVPCGANNQEMEVYHETLKEELHEMIVEATQKHEDFEKALANWKTQPPKAGDSYSFSLGEDCLYPFRVLVHQHPNNPELWYLVCDDGSGAFFFVGSLDVEVPDTDP